MHEQLGGVALLYLGDCAIVLKNLQNESIDLTITSPPYDNLRAYNGYSFDFENTAKELYRVTKNGGVVVWVVGDAVIDGSETGSSFKQALYFKELGFNLHDTMIYEKNSSTYPASAKSLRYSQIFEYMFILSKGRPKTVNLIKDKPNKWAGHKDFSGKLKNAVPDFSPRNNIWKYTTSFNDKTNHPAVFPEKLAHDHIISWSNEGDTVLDCFMGSGTTGKIAKNLNRNFIGIEVSEEYLIEAKKRIDKVG
jgi:site-specific DNA-methyltransferase (adenine-specific)